MKKYILSGIVIATFIAYSAYYRISGKVPNPFLSQASSTTSGSTSNVVYKDGTYTGDATDAYYGIIQVQAVIKGGKIADVLFLQYPNDRQHSIAVSQYAMPLLRTEAIQAQNANVDVVSGATQSSGAFVQSLQTALNRAL